MNARDDDQPDLFVHLSGAFEGEPEMRSRPGDDLDRGRRLQRRRRRGSVSASAAAVALLAVGGWALSGSIGSQGVGSTQVQTAGGGPEGPRPSGTITAECASSDSQTDSRGGGASLAPSRAGGGADAHGRSASATGTTSRDAGTATASDDPTDCTVIEGDSETSPGVDRLMRVLSDHTDPDGSHAGQMSMGGSAGSAGPDGSTDMISSIYAGMDWTDGDRAGAVSLSVEDPTGGVSVGRPCAGDPMPDGPDVTCESRTLADGTTVMVGHGRLDGAERITVTLQRPDGTVVTATADQATQQWWDDGSGAAPLAAPPATVDQLIEMVRDPGAHL